MLNSLHLTNKSHLFKARDTGLGNKAICCFLGNDSFTAADMCKALTHIVVLISIGFSNSNGVRFTASTLAEQSQRAT